MWDFGAQNGFGEGFAWGRRKWEAVRRGFGRRIRREGFGQENAMGKGKFELPLG